MAGRHALIVHHAYNLPDGTMGTSLYTQDPAGSGVWEHSRDRGSDLMKRWIVEERVYAGGRPAGWLALTSWDTEELARASASALRDFGGRATRICDQFKKEGN